jgi:hypothetical protein
VSAGAEAPQSPVGLAHYVQDDLVVKILTIWSPHSFQGSPMRPTEQKAVPHNSLGCEEQPFAHLI